MNNNTCFETPVPVKYLIACSPEKLLFINNSQILLRPPGKNLCKAHPLENFPLLEPLPSEFPLPSVEGRGGGGG